MGTAISHQRQLRSDRQYFEDSYMIHEALPYLSGHMGQASTLNSAVWTLQSIETFVNEVTTRLMYSRVCCRSANSRSFYSRFALLAPEVATLAQKGLNKGHSYRCVTYMRACWEAYSVPFRAKLKRKWLFFWKRVYNLHLITRSSCFIQGWVY